jgi:hypothetical protein
LFSLTFIILLLLLILVLLKWCYQNHFACFAKRKDSNATSDVQEWYNTAFAPPDLSYIEVVPPPPIEQSMVVATPGTAISMNDMVKEQLRLEQLHLSGELTNSEFAAARAGLLQKYEPYRMFRGYR